MRLPLLGSPYPPPHAYYRERGAVAVEFALIFPLLAMLLLGVVTAGLSYSHGLGLANAVREGSRFGATTESSSTWATDVITRTRALQFDDFSSPPETLLCAELRKVGAATALQTSGSCTGERQAPVSPTGFMADDCFVWVAATRPFSITLVVAPTLDGDMTRTSAARYERDCS